ncbi:MAG: phenylalanine--tRNA ligase subunit alpha [Candidatus Hydrogenedentes bacterium]|nr:phenylalanine--tRNA ligase subunit alpha [Candidatus Hydrogenedentota bacterium]
MLDSIDQIRDGALAEIAAAASSRDAEELRVKYLGRKGALTGLLRGVSDAPADQRPALGKAANELKNLLTAALDDRAKALAEAEAGAKDRSDLPDLSLPGRRPARGHMHLVSQVTDEIIEILSELGFQVATGPEVETEYYNFDSLNTPDDHPARDSHDTFFVAPGVVLRTHTSPVQMRVMERTQPPVAIVAPGRVYRVDADSTHSPMFYQVEGLLVDEGVSFADLKGTLMHFLKRLLGGSVQVRFNPHFFPFTEPSAEIHVKWTSTRGGQTQERLLEIGGCGMVHPRVFEYAGYDYERYTGFAFGMGVERIAMARHQINSIHHFYEGDLRFLEQF